MVQKKTTKRAGKKSPKDKDFQPTKMSLAVSAAAVTSLTLMAVMMVE